MNVFPPHRRPPHVKVCGLTRPEDALLALELGASFLGLIFAEGTPRCISPAKAEALLATVRQRSATAVRPFGVFVDESAATIRALVELLDLSAVQIHGTVREELYELGVPVVRAVRVKGPESESEIRSALARGSVLLDTFVEGRHGGTGKTFDHALATPHLASGRVFIAGGLNPDNIRGIAKGFAEKDAFPYAFDVSSGLEESPGVKSHGKMRRFFGELHAGTMA